MSVCSAGVAARCYREVCSDSRHWLEAGSEIPDGYTDSLLTYEPQQSNGSVYGQILNRYWEILPVERNLKEQY